jgi:hypothetical protein
MLTPYQKKDEDFTFDWDFLSWEHDRKRTVERRKLIFKTNALVPKTTVIRKEEGATVAASPTFSAAKQCGLVS